MTLYVSFIILIPFSVVIKGKEIFLSVVIATIHVGYSFGFTNNYYSYVAIIIN